MTIFPDFGSPKANHRLHGIYSRIIKAIRDTPHKQKCDLMAITIQVMGGHQGYPYVNAALNTMVAEGLLKKNRSPECGATGRYLIIMEQKARRQLHDADHHAAIAKAESDLDRAMGVVDASVAKMDMQMPNEKEFRAYIESEDKRAAFAAKLEAERAAKGDRTPN